MGSGQTKVQTRKLIESYSRAEDARDGVDPAEAAEALDEMKTDEVTTDEGVIRRTYSVKHQKAATKVITSVMEAAEGQDEYQLDAADAKTLLLSMGISKSNPELLDTLLAHVQDAQGKVKLQEFERAIKQAIEIEEDAEFMVKEVEQEVDVMKNMFDDMMEMLRWCDVWTPEQKERFIQYLEKPKLDFLVDAHDDCGNTMLIVATMGRQKQVIKLLLDHKANVNLQNASGFCPLHYSCSNPNPYTDEALQLNIDITSMLLAAGAKPDLRESTAGCTPLHYAASANNIKAVEELLKYNSRVGIRCVNGFLPEEYARAAGFDDLATLLQAEYVKQPEEAADASSLQGWQEHVDSATGRTFYYNHTTGESSWVKPEEISGGAEVTVTADANVANEAVTGGDVAATAAAGVGDGAIPDAAAETKSDVGNVEENTELSDQISNLGKSQPGALNDPVKGSTEQASGELKEVWKNSEFQESCARVIDKADTNVRQSVMVNLEKQQAAMLAETESKFKVEREAMQRQMELMKKELERAQAKATKEEAIRKDLETHAKEADSKFAAEYDSLRAKLQAQESSDVEQEQQLAKLKAEFEVSKKAELDRVKGEFEEQKKKELQEITARAQAAIRKQDEELKNRKKMLTDMEGQLAQEQEQRKKYYNEVEDLKGTIRVYARVRPMSKTEKAREGCHEVTHVASSGVDMEVKYQKESKGGDKKEIKKAFTFDACFAPGTSQDVVFTDTARLMQSAIDGYNVCIFAYGQTGAGKTYTMNGEPGEHAGIMPRAVDEIYRLMEKAKHRFKFSVQIYMCELHLDNLVDLLTTEEDVEKRPKLHVKKDRKGVVFVENITISDISSKEQLNETIQTGMSHRKTTSTAMNAESSRSHMVCSIIISTENLKTNIKSNGKLTLVDLAGSERSAKTGASGDTLKEGTSINKSLTALGDVIGALSSGQKHIPYRNHVLTQLMQDSLGGNAKTLMFVNVSPADYNAEETIASLTFAARCKTVTNSAGKDLETKEIAALRKEIAQLKKAGK